LQYICARERLLGRFMASTSKQAAIAQRKATAAKKDADKALGLNAPMKKAIAGDEVVCQVCLVTKMGPETECSCKGGKTKPGPDFDPIPALIAAAKARGTARKTLEKKEVAVQQKAVEKEREKKRGERGQDSLADLDNPDFVVQGGGNELTQVVEFEPAKLGFQLTKNSVSKCGSSGQAAALGVKVGWVASKINGTELPPDDAKIMKAAQKATKEGNIKFTFRVPVTDGFMYCISCDAFVSASSFDELQLDEGPGIQLCRDCEFTSGMDF